MTPRQMLAISRLLNQAHGLDTEPCKQVRKHPAGLLIMTILAIDR